MRFFDQDGGFVKYGSIIFDLIQLNFFVLLISIFTFGLGFGAAATAMMYSIDRTIFEENGYALKNFWKSFKLNWKQASILWAGALLVILTSRLGMDIVLQIGGPMSFLTIVQTALIIETIFILIYAIPMLALVDFKLLDLIKNAFVIAHKHFLTTLICLGLTGLVIFMSVELHGVFLLFLTSGVGLVVNQLVVRKVMLNYLTEEQKRGLFPNTLYTPKSYEEL